MGIHHIPYQNGDRIGPNEMIFIGDMPYTKTRIRFAYFYCTCGKMFFAPITEIKKGRRYKCQNCFCLTKQKRFIERALLVHGGKYDYSLASYIRGGEKVEIVCPVHGSFWQDPHNHMAGKGCSLCNKTGTNTRTSWILITRNRPCYLYVVNYFSDVESFIKVGITSQKSIEERVRRQVPYDFEILFYICGNAEFIYDSEKAVHRALRAYKYTPNLSFAGETECFNLPIKETIISYIKEINKKNPINKIKHE